MTVLAGCKINSQSAPPTTIIIIPTNTLVPPVSFTPRFTATLIPTITPIPSITPPATDTPIPATDTPTPTITPTPAISGAVNFTSNIANVRTGPGQKFALVTSVKAGSSVVVLGVNDTKDWYNVRLDDGSEGWLSSALITVANPATVPLMTTAQMTQSVLNATSVALTGTLGTTLVGLPVRKPFEKRRGDVLAYCDNPNNGEPRQTLPAGTNITVYWSWFAKTPEQLDDHVTNAMYQVKLDDQLLTNWQSFKSEVTKSPRDGNYYVFWYVPVGSPPAGEHRIDFQLSWKNQITDGIKKYGPGGDEETNTGSCVFTIK